MRLIDADELIKDIHEFWDWDKVNGITATTVLKQTITDIQNAPTVDAVPVRHGKWIEKHHAYSDEESAIEEWQSCRCSECGRYDTRPYMYYFDEPNYCSYCGALMKGEGDERNR